MPYPGKSLLRARARRCSARRLRERLPILLLLLCLHSSPAAAQEFGQWIWDALAGYRERSNQTVIDGQKISDTRTRELTLQGGMGGYLVHPALGNFRLGGEFVLSRASTGSSRNRTRLGLDAGVNLLPGSIAPSRLVYRRLNYSYSDLADLDPDTLVGIPDTGDVWSGNLRVRRGALKGVRLSYVNHRTSFLDESSSPAITENAALDWTRFFGKLQHRFFLERRSREFGTSDLAYDILALNVQERLPLSPRWRWELYGNGQRQDTFSRGLGLTNESYRVRTRFSRFSLRGDQLRLTYETGLARDGVERWRNGARVVYRWIVSPRWFLEPSLNYDRESASDRSLSAPTGDLTATWNQQWRQADATVTLRGGYGTLRYEDEKESRQQSDYSASVAGVFGHGSYEGLRKELEMDAGRNQLRLSRSRLVLLPGEELPIDGLSLEDHQRARFRLGHSWDSTVLTGWVEWYRSMVRGTLLADEYETERLTGAVQYNNRRFQVSGNLGTTSVDHLSLPDQERSFVGGSVSWKATRFLRARAVYGTNTRRLLLTPDLDGERYEIGVNILYGRILFDVFAFESTNQFDSGQERSFRGIQWSLAMRFGGWMPVVTGTQRKGVIR